MRWEEVLQDLVDQTKALSDIMELSAQGEHFLRVQEMGGLEGKEEVERVLRRHRKRLGTGSRERSQKRICK